MRDVRGQLADGGQLGRLHELGLRLLQLDHLLLDALVEPGVLDGQRALQRDALGQPQLVGGEAVHVLQPQDREAADQLVLPVDRLDQHRPVGNGLGGRHAAPRLGLAVRRRDRPLDLAQLGDHRGIDLQPGGQRSSQDVLGDVIADQRHEVGAVGGEQPGHAHVAAERADHLAGRATQDLGQLQRPADGLAHRDERLGVPQPHLGFLVEARVADGDGGRRGQRLHQRDLLGGELASLA